MAARAERLEATLRLTATGRVADRYIRHGVLIERFKNGLVRDVVAGLNRGEFERLLRGTESRLMRLRGRGIRALGTAGYADLLAMARERLNDGFRAAREQLASRLYDFARAEAQFSVNVLGKELAFDFRPKLPDVATFRELVHKMPAAGMTLKQRFQALAANTFGRFRRELNTGLMAGETAEQILRRVRGTSAARFTDGVLGRARHWTALETRTAAAAVAAGARRGAHRANRRVIRMERWTAVLDSRTCPICAALDGQTFKLTEGPQPPMHHQCRCERLPGLKSARQLGRRKAEPGVEPFETTFPAWLRRQPARVQDEVLGATRARLWRSGRLKITQFVNDRHQLLTLEQLARKEGLDLKALRRGTRERSEEAPGRVY